MRVDALELSQDHRGQHQVLKLARADDANGILDALHAAGKSVEGAIGDAEQAGAQRLVVAKDGANACRGTGWMIDRLLDLKVDVGQRCQGAHASDDGLGADGGTEWIVR